MFLQTRRSSLKAHRVNLRRWPRLPYQRSRQR